MQNTQTPAPVRQAPAAKEEPKPAPPPEFQSASIDKLDQAGLIALLKDAKSSVFQKAKACQRLSVIGNADAVPALAALLGDAQLCVYARYGLEPIPGSAPDDALRAALSKVSGKQLTGVINSIGQRHDAKAAPALGKMLYGPDPDAGAAAAAALGRISGPEAARTLEKALGQTKDPMFTAVARAGLVCAEGLLAQGDRKQALAFYDTLSRPAIPKAVRLAAMRAIIAAETALDRPR